MAGVASLVFGYYTRWLHAIATMRVSVPHPSPTSGERAGDPDERQEIKMKRLLVFVFELGVAIFSPAVLQIPVYSLWHPAFRSVSGTVIREFTMSCVIAGIAGIMLRHFEPFRVAGWIWILPCGWFLVGVFLRWSSMKSGSVLDESMVSHHLVRLWRDFALGDCIDCVNYPLDAVVFTVPFLRGTSFSLGALIRDGASRFIRNSPPSKVAPSRGA